MNRKANKREGLFLRGAEAWQRISGDQRALYVCPICTRGFTFGAVAAGVLSLEHAPPRALGGKALALTCKDCNSRAGHTVDAASNALDHLVALSEAMSPTGRKITGTGKLQLLELPSINVAYVVERGNVQFNVLRPRNNPASFERHLAAVNEALKGGTTRDFRYKFTPNTRFHPRRALVGHLRAAYLALFAGFGYRYALSRQLDVVRDQLKRYNEQLIEHAWIRRDEKGRQPPIIFGLSEPVRAFAVVLPRMTVLMPALDGPTDPWSVFATVGKKTRGRVSLTGLPLGWPAGLVMQYDFQQEDNAA